MRGRIYDARIGRFLQADPPFMQTPFWSQGLNRYSYVFNNPLNATDPSGFYEEHEEEGTPTTMEDPDEVVWDPSCQGDCDDPMSDAGDQMSSYDDADWSEGQSDDEVDDSGMETWGEGAEAADDPDDSDAFDGGGGTGADLARIQTEIDAANSAPWNISDGVRYGGPVFVPTPPDQLELANAGAEGASNSGELPDIPLEAGTIEDRGVPEEAAAPSPAAIAGRAAAREAGSFASRAAANLRALGLGSVKLAGRSYNAGRKALEQAGFRLTRTTRTGRKVFENPRTGASVVYDSRAALTPGQGPHWHIFDRAGRQYSRSGRLVDSSEGAAHIPGY
jgi:hypothetical protein